MGGEAEIAQWECDLAQVTSLGSETARPDKLLRSLRRTQIGIALSYLYDSLILFGFWAAGFVGLLVPITVFVVLAALVGAVNLAHSSGWSRTRSDPTLFLPQQGYAIAVALCVALVAPQIGFQPLATLFAICAFSFMAPNARLLILCWTLAAVGAVTVIFIVGSRLAMPTSSAAGQVLTAGVVIGLLARCIWIATFFQKLQRRLTEKNKLLMSAVQRIEVLANIDELTGLENRRAIMKSLVEQIALCDRTGLPMSIAILDIDHFKKINDVYGHLAGDRALQLFTERAAGTIRTTDKLGRYGGEEFLLVLVATGLRDAGDALTRIRARIAGWDWSTIDPSLRVTITIGATEYVKGDSAEDLIRRADAALYLGKASGRDRVVLDHGAIEGRPLREVAAAPL
jgi:diguanylate cyclase